MRRNDIMDKLIVGLGNYDKKYEKSRHNLGFRVLEELRKQQGLVWQVFSGRSGMWGKTTINNVPCSLLMPMTFMNNSGTSVRKVVEKSGFKPENILIIFDDMSLPFEKIRFRPSGSSGGHNGLNSIIAELGTNKFNRLRLGIGRPDNTADAVDYVLSNFTPAEEKALPDFINCALDCVTCWVREGAQAAMNRFNFKKEGKQ